MPATALSLRAELTRRRPKSITRGYPRELRARAGAWLLEQHATGRSWKALAEQIGISNSAANIWARAARASPSDPSTFLPVVLSSETDRYHAPSAAPTLHTPSGYWVSGLALDELVTLLRELE